MADTVVFQSVTPSTPPDATVIATDDAGAAGQVQIVKLAQSANGSATPITADGDGMLVNLGANNDVTVATLPLPAGAATEAKQDAGNSSLVTLIAQTYGVEAVLASLDGKTVAVNTGAVVVASSALPAGASTSAKQDTQTTELTSIKTAVEIIDNAISGAEMQVDVVTSALPTGAATSALQTQPGVDIGDVTVNNAAGASAVNIQDGGNSITVDGTVTASIAGVATEATLATRALESGGNLAAAAASLAVLDNIVAGSEAQVDIVAALPAGTNNIGDVDVLSLPALPAGNNNIGDVDVATIAAGDNNIGNVDIVTMPTVTVNAHAVTNAGTFVTQENGALLTAAQLLDDAVITDDTTTFTPATSKALAIAAAVDDDSTDAADEGDMVILRATKERKLRVVATLASGDMQSGNDVVTPKFVAIAASSSGDNTVVAGVGSKKLRVLSYVLMASGTVNAKFQSSTGGDITGLLYMVANTGASSGFSPVGHFETVAGEDLQLNLSAAIAVGGHLTYIEVD